MDIHYTCTHVHVCMPLRGAVTCAFTWSGLLHCSDTSLYWSQPCRLTIDVSVIIFFRHCKCLTQGRVMAGRGMWDGRLATFLAGLRWVHVSWWAICSWLRLLLLLSTVWCGIGTFTTATECIQHTVHTLMYQTTKNFKCPKWLQHQSSSLPKECLGNKKRHMYRY